jgi:hypothetical protein
MFKSYERAFCLCNDMHNEWSIISILRLVSLFGFQDTKQKLHTQNTANVSPHSVHVFVTEKPKYF